MPSKRHGRQAKRARQERSLTRHVRNVEDYTRLQMGEEVDRPEGWEPPEDLDKALAAALTAIENLTAKGVV